MKFIINFTKNKINNVGSNSIWLFYVCININIIINCSAYTNVIEAENELTIAEAVNVTAVRNLAKLSHKHSVQLIHISTDSVFNGSKDYPYTEYDITDPLNAYSRSKLGGEKAMMLFNPKNSAIIRTSWLYSKYGSNFVKTILQLATEKKEISIVNDQIGSPTHAKDLAVLIMNILPNISNEDVEIYHYSNSGFTSWYGFAKQIVSLSGKNCTVLPISTATFGAPVNRPAYSVLDTNKLIQYFNIEVLDWKDSLKECLTDMGIHK